MMASDVAPEGITGRNILVPVDDSEASDRALKWAIENQYRPGDCVFLANVVHGAVGHVGERVLVYRDSFKDKPAKEKEFINKRFGEILLTTGVTYKVAIILADKTEETIAESLIRYAIELNAAFVVIGKHDKGIRKWLAGGGICKQIVEMTEIVVVDRVTEMSVGEQAPMPVIILNANPAPHSLVKGRTATASFKGMLHRVANSIKGSLDSLDDHPSLFPATLK